MRLLIYDLETSNLDAAFGQILCAGYKWHGAKKVHIISPFDFAKPCGECKRFSVTNDSQILEAFRPIVEEADAVESIREAWGKLAHVGFSVCKSDGEGSYQVVISYPTLNDAQAASAAMVDISKVLDPEGKRIWDGLSTTKDCPPVKW